MRKYKLSDKDIARIDRDYTDSETRQYMKKMELENKIEWVESNMPSEAPLTADGGDISLEEYRRNLEKEIGLVVAT